MSVLVLAVAAVSSWGVVRVTLGVMGSTRVLPSQEDRPARLRTIAMVYVQAETEFLRDQPYELFRNAACVPPAGAPSPLPDSRTITPASGTPPRLSNEPLVPQPFDSADVLLADEPAVGPLPSDSCLPRRVTINVYLTAADRAASPPNVFLRGETAVAPR